MKVSSEELTNRTKTVNEQASKKNTEEDEVQEQGVGHILRTTPCIILDHEKGKSDHRETFGWCKRNRQTWWVSNTSMMQETKKKC